MRESPNAGRLVSVRLTEVPLEIRVRAADGVRPARVGEEQIQRPEDRLFARLADGHDDLLAAAVSPSNRVYWITERAYRSILG